MYYLSVFPLLLLLVACRSNTNTSRTPAPLLLNDSISITAGQHTFNFLSKDSLPITGTLYHIAPDLPIILLCHQAGSSKDEYSTIAPRLNELGYNCLAIDQRSGGKKLGGNNPTAIAAQKANKPTDYLSAEQDILAAIDTICNLYHKSVVLLGSSYSASLAMKIGASSPKVKSVIAFSPGEYFSEQSDTYLSQYVRQLKKPLFITSSKSEAEACKTLFNFACSRTKVQFIPSGEGIHGARALWQQTPNHAEYWDALVDFLKM
ncbi:MAG: alpha/beta hydrolase [Chitinophagales bacterium]|nr:alpha/beta hydrolase [Chitinophagales bacterium]